MCANTSRFCPQSNSRESISQTTSPADHMAPFSASSAFSSNTVFDVRDFGVAITPA
ncbi:MAG: hypothetical protein JWQ11_485, partial [Rhizobacter sp.]|nr:hypothetical protein [Rhizobacter sp.]